MNHQMRNHKQNEKPGRSSQPLAELGGILGGAEGVDEALEGGDGCVDLENTSDYRLGRILPSSTSILHRISPPFPRQRPARLEILKAHLLFLLHLPPS